MLHRTLIVLAGLLACSSDAAESNGFVPGRYIGFWNDGSGVYRDCNPVTTWNETDVTFSTEEEPDRFGILRKRYTATGSAGQYSLEGTAPQRLQRGHDRR